MKRKLFTNLKPLIATILLALAIPAWADHGKLGTTVRDSWINWDANELVAAGLISEPQKPMDQMTNLEVAELTAEAAQRYMAQADTSLLPPPLPGGQNTILDNGPGLPASPSAEGGDANKSMADLVEEFRGELITMGLDVDKLEDRIADAQTRNEVFASLQKDYLKRTGTEVSGFSRGYMYNYRGFGADALYSPMGYNAAMFIEMDLKSIPVPSILFDARLRLWRSIGMYYQDPVQPPYQLRWISLSSYNDFGNIMAGDFYKNYTPLTLWNDNAPVYTFVDPTSFRRTRLDTEELVYMDQAPAWHMRGFQGDTGKEWPQDPFLSGFSLQAMTGSPQDPGSVGGANVFGSYYAGGQGSIGFLSHHLDFTATGLTLYNDPGSAAVPYLANVPSTYPRQYMIGSVTSKAVIPLGDQADLSGSMENAFSQYNDNLEASGSVFKDWALLANGSLDVAGVHVTAKYVNNGPYFYSPGAQTNPYTPDSGSPGYLGTNLGSELSGLDSGLPGYLNQYVFQSVGRPFYAPYDRLSENFLPYGDATPNRVGLILGFSGDIGNNGWLKPQASYVVSGQEIQPNYVLSGGTTLIPVDSQTNTTTSRVFGGYEGALTVDFAKAFALKNQTYDIQGDYKHQTDNLGLGGVSPFTVNTWILATDFNIPADFISTLVWSFAIEQAQSSGSEYVFGGNPPTWASYSFYLDDSNLGSYVYEPLNITRQTLAFGVLYPLGDKVDFRADLFLTNYHWSDFPTYDRQDQIWRFTYEAHF